MLLMIMPGVISLTFGLVFLCAPQRLQGARPGRKHSRNWIETDPVFLKYRVSVGLCLLTIGIFCLSSAFYVWLRLNS